MLKTLMTAGALAGMMLMTASVGSAQAAPSANPELAKASSGVTLVGRGGRGGGRGGGGWGRGGGGGGYALRGGGSSRGFSSFRSGPRVGGYRSYGGSRGVYRSDRGRKFSQYGGRRHHGHKHRRNFRGFAFYGAPYVYGYYSGYGSCGWLYRRAIATGSPYWWDRYYACSGGDYYDYY